MKMVNGLLKVKNNISLLACSINPIGPQNGFVVIIQFLKKKDVDAGHS